MFGKGQGYGVTLRKVGLIQQKIEGWEGPDILSCCTKLIKGGLIPSVKSTVSTTITNFYYLPPLQRALSVSLGTVAEG